MATTPAEARFIALPDEETLAATTVALEEHGFSVEVVTISPQLAAPSSTAFRTAPPS